MLKYILKRLFISIFVLLGVSIIIYTLVRMMPNDYLDIKFSSQLQQGTITLDQLAEFKAQYGIGDNSFKGLVDGYFTWLTNMLKGDFGTSFKYEKTGLTGMDVVRLCLERCNDAKEAVEFIKRIINI